MKVACEACGSRYAIPDAKVQGVGRTFKVTCQQCGELILIKGVAEGAAGAWYFAVGKERKGPVDGAGLSAAIASGELTKANLVWRNGMSGWMPLGEVDELSSLFVDEDATEDGGNIL